MVYIHIYMYVYYVVGRATQSVLLLRALGMAEPLALVATLTRGHLVTKGVGSWGRGWCNNGGKRERVG